MNAPSLLEGTSLNTGSCHGGCLNGQIFCDVRWVDNARVLAKVCGRLESMSVTMVSMCVASILGGVLKTSLSIVPGGHHVR